MEKSSYSKLPTEQANPRSKNIDRVSIEKIISIINQEDKQVPKAVAKAKPQIARTVKLIVRSLKSGGRIFFTGAGTSGRLGILEAAECPPTFGTSPSLIQGFIAGGKKAVFRSIEGAEDDEKKAVSIFRKKLSSQDVLIGIAASGITPFVCGALKAARAKKASSILISCNASSPMKRRADCLIAINVGPEVITGSTRLKAGTATKLVLNTLTVASMIQIGKVYKNWMVDVQPKNKKLEARALRLIERLGSVDSKKALLCFEKAKRNVKLAIIMAKKNWNLSLAEKKLNEHSGFLRKLLN